MTLESRIQTTGVAVAIILMANALVVPALPPELMNDDGPLRSLFQPQRVRVLSLGIQPYLAAATFWLLLSGGIASLRRKRDGSASERASFDREILWLALIVGLMQAVSYTYYVRVLISTYGYAGALPSFAFTVTLQLAGLCLLIWVAFYLTRMGVGNGVAWVALTTLYVAQIPAGAESELERLSVSRSGLFRLPLVLALLAGLVGLCWFYVNHSRSLALARLEPSEATEVRPPPAFPLRFNLVGLIPVIVAGSLLALLEIMRQSLPGLPEWLAPTGALRWILVTALVILLSYVIAGIAFDTRHVGPMLERFGYRLADVPAGASTEAFLDRLIERRTALSGLVLSAIVLVPDEILDAVSGISLGRAGFSGPFVLVACAIITDTMRQSRALRSAEPAPPEPALDDVDPSEDEAPDTAPLDPEDDVGEEPEPDAWVAVFESDVEFECRLALELIMRDGTRAVVVCNRVIPVTGTLAFWEWTVPSWPSLVIHRRLGGGRAVVQVPESQADRARETLGRVLPSRARAQQ